MASKKRSKVVFGKPIAVLVDGAYFLKRYSQCFKDSDRHEADQVAKNLYSMVMAHVEDEELYRIFYYDCPPLEKKVHNPISGEVVDYSKSDTAIFRRALHRELARMRKVALRLGVLKDQTDKWRINPAKLKKLFRGEIEFNTLKTRDIRYEITQKGVDMRLGLDIASLAYKKHVSRIILVTGDSDFVPASKLARREGLDVILDPMWQRVSDDLYLHIDGLKSTCPKPPPIKRLKPAVS
jgi:uncharacterized LabA/DUF88 family protein